MAKLSHKVWIGVLGSLVVTSVATIGLVLHSEHTVLQEELEHSGKTLARTIAAFCVDNLLEYEYPGLADYIRRSAEESAHVAYIRIWKAAAEDPQVAVQHPEDLSSILETAAFATFRAPVVIEAEGTPPELLGEVEVALSTQRLSRLRAESTTRLLLGAGLSFAVLALVIGLVLRKSVLDPVKSLDSQAQRIGAGDFVTPVVWTTRDELGRLGQTMEHMRANLRESHARIERQVEQLKEHDRMKDEFLANTSHELKTPLHGILGLADNIRNGNYGALPAALSDPLDKISGCATRLWRMTEEILTFSKLVHGDGSQAVEAERFHLTELIEEAIVDLRATAERKGLDLAVAIDPAIEVSCPRKPLEDLVRVLTDNAVKYTDRGRVEILGQRWPNGAAVPGFQLAVRDTGIGISKEAQAKIFEPFVQGFGHETRAHGGVGLGLAIAAKLLKVLGAEVVLESEVGKGSSFTVLVPEVKHDGDLKAAFVPWTTLGEDATAPVPADRKQTEGPAARRQSSSEERAPEPRDRESFVAAADAVATKDSPWRVLVADDEPINREVLTGALQAEFQVSAVPDGEHCLAALRQGNVDLLVLDIMMPGLSGYDVLSRMREEGLLERTPVIVLSAKSSPQSVVKGLELGASDYLGKPFHREELLCRIRTQLQILAQRRLLEKEIREKSQALRTAERASYVKTQFLANMSHEIRTPINGILGFATLGAEDGAADPNEQRELFANIEQCTSRLLKVVDDIFDLTKIESRELEFVIAECDPGRILAEVRRRWAPQAREKGLELTVEQTSELERPIWSDARRLEQVIDCVVDNAIKFTPQGRVTVHGRRVRHQALGTEFIEVAVTDTGIGIEDAKIDEVFIPFLQADISMRRSYGGTGLGLSLARLLARMLGGDVTVESELGRGSTFTITVPVDSRRLASKAGNEKHASERTREPAVIPA
jgi:signal transduction histidine kinase